MNITLNMRIACLALFALFNGVAIAAISTSSGGEAIGFGTDLIEIKTAAGSLSCASTLCKTTLQARDIKPTADSYSKHIIRLSSRSKDVSLTSRIDFGGTPYYQLSGMKIGGENAYVPGDGYLYVRQSGLSDFVILKRYRVSESGKLVRVKQDTYPLNHTLQVEKDVEVLASPTEASEAIETIRSNSPVHVVSAIVDEDENMRGQAKWFEVDLASGNTGWVKSPHERLIPQCQSANENSVRICYNGD